MAGALSQREIYRELCKITEPTNPEKGRFSCVGYAPTQGRRCWNIVNSADISSFEAQLRSFTEADLRHPDARSSKLRAMAGHGLCVRYHRKTQITEVASRWDHEITIWLRRRAAVEQQSPRVSERPRARVSPNTSASSPIRARETGASETHSPRATAPTTVQEAYNTPREEIIETVERTSGLQSVSRERIRPTLASSPRVASFTSSRMSTLESLPSPPRSEFTFTAQRQPIAVNSSHAPGHVRDYAGIFAPSRPRTAVLAGQTGAPSTTVPVSPPQAHPTTTPVQQATSPAAIPEGVPSPVDSVMISPVAPTAPPAPEPAPCTQDHARRKTTDDECPICQSSMATNELADLVWCKAQCGTNFHRECWTMWERTRRSSRSYSSLTCVYCRTNWYRACEHDNTHPPYSFWTTPSFGPTDGNHVFRDLFEPRNHAWSLWSSAYEDDSHPFALLFNAARHTRPLLRERRARADILALPDSEADELSTLFNIREHVRAQAWCLWRAGPGADTDAGFEALFDAKRHKRGVKSERWAAASVLDAAGEKDGGVLGDLFEEKWGIIAPKDEMSQPRGCQMVG
ncbi:hypothetical protein B0J12DRAFT_694077 [Macrophomina phaseolina]|uniref:RING-type domain-containing protein n=1 Tax=Macrophomina phaseolina TaxID=35725 RepID=A0ABQ8GUD0_9PEZI|nr:hypothetical protein B0J12DRAFT_694077 [Macrophomina phaseolina]